MFDYLKRMEEYVELTAEINTTVLAYRATVKAPHLFTGEEIDFVEQRLADLYAKRDRLDQEFELDPP